jgi:hypothetical protein
VHNLLEAGRGDELRAVRLAGGLVELHDVEVADLVVDEHLHRLF